MNSSLIVIALLTAAPQTATTGPNNPSDERLRDVVANGLSFLGKEGPAFQNKKSCITCHHGPLTVWSQRESATLGFSVDQASLDEFEDKLLARFRRKKGAADKNQWRHTQASFFTLGQPENWNPTEEPETMAALIDAITGGQQEDGSWKAANQFSGQARPKGEADLLQTMWNTLALARFEVHDKSLVDNRETALKWMGSAPAPVSMDARAVQLLIEHRFGDTSRTRKILGSMLDDQNDDGSWGWVAGGKGDAWGTGITLYALSYLGDEIPVANVRSAQSFLADSQTEDGSWFVPTKLKGEEHESVISSYFGTVWSVMGLASTICSH